MELTVEIIKRIIHAQFPEYQDLIIEKVRESGHDNQTFHLGNHLTLRFPSAEAYSSQVIKEAKYCKELQMRLSLPITCPIALGKPSKYFPYHFAINQWIEGETVNHKNIVDMQQFAQDLANFLLELHNCNPNNGPIPSTHNFFRGGSLSVYHDETIEAIKFCVDFDKVKCLEVWMRGVKSAYINTVVWVHGDLEVGNILVKNGHLSAIIDFGNMAIGDPACDYVMAWTYFDQETRKIFFDTLNLDIESINRARAWALWKALITLNDPIRKANAYNTMNEIFKEI